MTTSASDSAKLVILYVEDDDLTRGSVTNRLRRRGFEVLSAASGEQALDLIADRPALSAVLMDVELPGMDGLVAYAHVQKSYPNLPIVICSGALSPDVCRCVERIGIPNDHCLCKPCPFAEILDAVCKVTASKPSVPAGRG